MFEFKFEKMADTIFSKFSSDKIRGLQYVLKGKLSSEKEKNTKNECSVL
jgi:hypothetical protein